VCVCVCVFVLVFVCVCERARARARTYIHIYPPLRAIKGFGRGWGSKNASNKAFFAGGKLGLHHDPILQSECPSISTV